MAPELLFGVRRESGYSNAVDIWSLGTLLFYLLSKKPAFPGFRDLDEYYQGSAPFPDSALVQHGVSSSGRHFIKNLMSPVPEDRPNASTALLDEWEIAHDYPPEHIPTLHTADAISQVLDSSSQPPLVLYFSLVSKH